MRPLRISLLLSCLLALFGLMSAAYTPCSGKALLGEDCDITADCEHKGSVCLRGKCRCHLHYIERSDENRKTSRCVKLPSKIGQSCNGKCREPLFCRSGRCQCVQRGNTKIINGECVLITNVGDRCTRHYDCTSPFTACVKSRCTCISGTVQQGRKCLAERHCPLGGQVSLERDCARSAEYQEVVENMFNSGSKADDCPAGHFCVTPADSPLGHCCPVLCPLNTAVDTHFSCDPNSSNYCPSDTHHCHRLAGAGYAFAVCCRRPCNPIGPKAVYLKGVCVSRGYIKSPCSRQEQCDAVQSMYCSRGECQCRGGFSPFSDALTNPVKNPSQVCRRMCSVDRLSRDVDCHQKVSLNDQCFIQTQCPNNAGCYRGRCLCRCGFEPRNGHCREIPPPPTTTARPASIPDGQDFLGIIGQLLKRGGGNLGSLFVPQPQTTETAASSRLL